MFEKVIVFGLFEMNQKKKRKRVRTASLGSGSAFGSGRVRFGGTSRHITDFETCLDCIKGKQTNKSKKGATRS